MITTQELKALKDIIKIDKLIKLAGIKPTAISNSLYNHKELGSFIAKKLEDALVKGLKESLSRETIERMLRKVTEAK